ncbi:unnamed protein product [Brachionus calyciflorus]|uniref:MULE transposase domain-containing protein n=1 Tax=Brachionus calyciflorus TaxID=104777 RepID=A0A814FZS5_9BILA|nr:unnamed protein product [Brachionus calyciflorus]
MDQEILYLDTEFKKIITEKHRYQKNEKKSSWYRCVNRKCGALFNLESMERNKVEHYHPSLTNCEIDCIMFFKQLVQNVISDHDIPLIDAYNRQYQKLIAKYSYNEIVEHWKPFTVIKSNLRYHRNQTKPNNPKQVKDIQINEIYSTLNSQQFLQFDNKDNNNRILILMTPIGMKILSNSKRWHFDGSFKTCPTHFLQIFSVHGYYQNQMYPACYILLQNKERETYVEALTKMKEILTGNNDNRFTRNTL